MNCAATGDVGVHEGNELCSSTGDDVGNELCSYG